MVRLRIRELAEERGLNITELSFRTRIAYKTVHAYWHDTPKNLSREVLRKLARALGVLVPDLLSDDGA